MEVALSGQRKRRNARLLRAECVHCKYPEGRSGSTPIPSALKCFFYLFPGASHAHDLFPMNIYDPPWMKKTRKDVERILASWLS